MGLELVGSGTIRLRLSGKYWRIYAEILFSFFKQTNRRWEHSFPRLSRRAAVLWLLAAMKSYFLQGRSLCDQITLNQAGKFSSQCIAFPPKPFRLVPGPMTPSVGPPSAAGDRVVLGAGQAGACAAYFFYYYCFLSGALFSGGDGVGWRGARGSPVLARKPDAWSHCLALPGKAGKASAGVIKQHAGAAGSEQPASEVPLDLSSKPLDSKCHRVKPTKEKKKKVLWVPVRPRRDRSILRWARTLWL